MAPERTREYRVQTLADVRRQLEAHLKGPGDAVMEDVMRRLVSDGELFVYDDRACVSAARN